MFGSVRTGIHQTWHTIPDDMYNGSPDYFRGLVGVDGSYTDAGAFEHYSTDGLAGKYQQVATMMQASSLAKLSKSGVAIYNRWGVYNKSEVAVYWAELMPLFSTNVINIFTVHGRVKRKNELRKASLNWDPKLRELNVTY